MAAQQAGRGSAARPGRRRYVHRQPTREFGSPSASAAARIPIARTSGPCASPSEPDAGEAAVQELMGERFDEMSTFMNYMRGGSTPHWRRPDQALPLPADPDGEDPSASRTSSAAITCVSTASRRRTISSSRRASTAPTQRQGRIWSSSTRHLRECLPTIGPPSRRSSLPTTCRGHRQDRRETPQAGWSRQGSERRGRRWNRFVGEEALINPGRDGPFQEVDAGS